MYSNLHFSNFLKITGNLGLKAKRLSFLLLLTIVLIASTAIKSTAQNALDLSSTLESMKASTDINIQTQGAYIENLVYKIQPKLYINNGILKTYEADQPVCAELDVHSISKLSESNALFNQVEMITIKLNSSDDLNFVLDFSSFQSFNQLKYINFLCNFNCTPEQINKLFVQNANSGITVFYNISIEN